jgi:hypothetical protein
MHQLVSGTEQVDELGSIFSLKQIMKGNEPNYKVRQTSEHKETN